MLCEEAEWIVSCTLYASWLIEHKFCSARSEDLESEQTTADIILSQGRTQGEAPGAGALPLGAQKHKIFSVSFVKSRDISLCDTYSEAFCYL